MIDVSQGLIKLVNQKIISREGSREVIEGCLSNLNIFGKLTSPQIIRVQVLNKKSVLIWQIYFNRK